MRIEAINKNHQVIHTKEGAFLFSYGVLVASVKANGTVYVYPKWNYSRTTTKYVCNFLGYVSKKDVEKAIKEGKIIFKEGSDEKIFE